MDLNINVGTWSAKGRPDVGPTLAQRRAADVGTPTFSRRKNGFQKNVRRRPDVGPTKCRRRADVGRLDKMTSGRRRLWPKPTSGRRPHAIWGVVQSLVANFSLTTPTWSFEPTTYKLASECSLHYTNSLPLSLMCPSPGCKSCKHVRSPYSEVFSENKA